MARRDEGILDLLVTVPWWVSVALSATAFILLRFVVPAFIPAGPATSSNYALKGVLGGVSSAAPLVALVLLIPAPIAAFRQWREGRLIDKQKDLATIRTLPWRRFETLVREAYHRQGYAVRGHTGDGPDGGVDLTLMKDGNVILVQCKQWKALKVGVNVVREMYGVMTAKHAHGAIVITSGLFTQEAKNFAAGRPIDLVEGQQLADLIGVVQKPPAHTSRPNHSSTPATPRATSTTGRQPAGVPKDATPLAQAKLAPKKICPKCGAEMLLRTAQRGAHAGQQFWGCSQFPRCRATLPTDDYKKG
jgi:restriction system protein